MPRRIDGSLFADDVATVVATAATVAVAINIFCVHKYFSTWEKEGSCRPEPELRQMHVKFTTEADSEAKADAAAAVGSSSCMKLKQIKPKVSATKNRKINNKKHGITKTIKQKSACQPTEKTTTIDSGPG